MRKLSQIATVFLAIFLVAGMAAFAAQIEGVTNFTGVHIQATAQATATPLLMVENDGVSRSFEVRNSSATPVYAIDNDGSVTQSGATTAGGNLDMQNNQITNIGAAGTDFSATGGLTLADQLSVSSGGADVTGIFGLPATAYTLTGAQTITPTTTYYELAPTSTLTATLAGGTAGDLLILANTVTTSTIIVDTGATAGGGNITLGENDVAGFIKVDDTWAELFSPDNS
jgi:hypothetical protein